MKATALKTRPAKTYVAIRKNKGESIYKQVRNDLDSKFKR